MMISMFMCRGCNIKFDPRKKGQEYHDIDCFRRSTTKWIKCPECGAMFKRKFTDQICCSAKCGFANRAKKNTKGKYFKCEFCDRHVYRMQSKIKDRKFCNRNCTVAYLRSPQNTSMSKGWKHTQEARKKIGQARIGRKLSKENIEKMIAGTKSRKWTSQQREAARQRKLGVKNTVEQNLKIRLRGRYGIENNMWKGDFASYAAMHMWVVRHRGKAQKCIDGLYFGIDCKGRFEWSNIDHKYRRNFNDYEERCTRHHRIFDLINGLTSPNGMQARFFSKARGIHVSKFIIDARIINHNEMVEDINRTAD